MSRILFLESVSGVAGDMFAAAFVDAPMLLFVPPLAMLDTDNVPALIVVAPV